MPISYVDALFDRLACRVEEIAVIEGEHSVTGRALVERSARWAERLRDNGVGPGDVCALIADYEIESIFLLLALMQVGAIAMPLSPSAREVASFISIAGARWLLARQANGEFSVAPTQSQENELVRQFRASEHAGLVVFTSGSSGEPKGILHDCERVLSKFATERPSWRTVLFLMMDHFGGLNTLFGCLSFGGAAISVADRRPETVCRAIEAAKAELLPTTPTFLKMLIASGVWRAYDLSSLKLITYGTEPMPEATLQQVRSIFSNAVLKQTYGLSELGVLHTKSPDPASLWLRVGGKGFETKIKDDVLLIRSSSNMVGYLNAPSPVDAEGWMNTGDLVEQRNGLIRFLGRTSEVINVGGQKVFPTEVENTLLEADGVIDATVYAARHPLLGQAVCARVSLSTNEESEAAARRLRGYCLRQLTKFKVPMRIEVVTLPTQSTRRSKKRRPSIEQPSGEPQHVVLISGASRGLGMGLTRALLVAGHKIAAFSRTRPGEIDALLARHSGHFFHQEADLADTKGFPELVARAEASLGPITTLINNAGMIHEALLARQSAEVIDKLIDVNLRGTLLLTRQVVRGMMIRQRGTIINISSIVSISGYKGTVAYSAAKGGIDAMTRALARELGGRNITVNSIAPGYMQTEMTAAMSPKHLAQIVRRTPLGRAGRVEDVVELVLFLMSSGASFISGQTIVVDGGLTA